MLRLYAFVIAGYGVVLESINPVDTKKVYVYIYDSVPFANSHRRRRARKPGWICS